MPDGIDALRYHGGNINAARHLFPEAREPWIDLSTGINSEPYPVDVIAPAAWTRLPAPAELAALEDAARIAYGAGSAAGIVAAPGTQALIQWLPRIFPARRVGVLGLTYREHETSWRASGADVATVADLADLAAFEVAVVVNPNNPDGRICAPDELARLAAMLTARGGRLIVDEAFMDVLERPSSLVPRLPVAGAIVLRSFGKTYGLAGLRLGFALASAPEAERLRDAIGPWAVSGPAIELGRRALADEAWLIRTIGRLREAADRMDRLLRSAGFDSVAGTPLFRFARQNEAAETFEQLCRAGILTRPFEARPNWLRFGIPSAPQDWERLEAALHPHAGNGDFRSDIGTF